MTGPLLDPDSMPPEELERLRAVPHLRTRKEPMTNTTISLNDEEVAALERRGVDPAETVERILRSSPEWRLMLDFTPRIGGFSSSVRNDGENC